MCSNLPTPWNVQFDFLRKPIFLICTPAAPGHGIVSYPLEGKMHSEDSYRDAPVFLLTIDENMLIETASKTAQKTLGDCKRCAIGKFVDTRLALELGDLMQSVKIDAPPIYRALTFRRQDGERIVVAGLVDKVSCGDSPKLRITALYDSASQPWLEELIHSEDLHRAFVQASSEAMWCIDFSEPVDLTQGDHEIIRQVFENECRWLMCNEAMARLYNLPKGLDFNRQPVSLYFPRNLENETFVRQIIESDFSVDKVLSIDTSHDGSSMYMENTVHCNIQDGCLLRMYGSVRDVTGYRQVQNRLTRDAQDVRSILNAIPDAILVINRDRRLLAVNASFEALFGWKQHQFLGQDIQTIIDLEAPLPNGRRWYGIDHQRWTTEVRIPTGRSVMCDAQIFPVGEEAPDRFVLTLHPAHE